MEETKMLRNQLDTLLKKELTEKDQFLDPVDMKCWRDHLEGLVALEMAIRAYHHSSSSRDELSRDDIATKLDEIEKKCDALQLAFNKMNIEVGRMDSFMKGLSYRVADLEKSLK